MGFVREGMGNIRLRIRETETSGSIPEADVAHRRWMGDWELNLNTWG